MPTAAKPKVNLSQAVRDQLAKNPKAKVVEIHEALAKEGIKVSVALINKVKYAKPKGKKRGRPAKSAAKAASNGKPKAKVNRSQAIRDYFATSPNASLAEVKAALAKNGIKVSDSLINAVKYKKPKGIRGRKRGRPAVKGKGPRPAAANVSIDLLVAAKKLVDSLGGIENATAAIDVLKRLEQ